MKRSTDRILTTHVGSLPRPDDLAALIRKKAQGEAVDEAAFAARVKSAIAETVRHRAEADCRERQLLGPVARIPGLPGILCLDRLVAGHRRPNRAHALGLHRP